MRRSSIHRSEAGWGTN